MVEAEQVAASGCRQQFDAGSTIEEDEVLRGGVGISTNGVVRTRLDCYTSAGVAEVQRSFRICSDEVSADQIVVC